MNIKPDYYFNKRMRLIAHEILLEFLQDVKFVNTPYSEEVLLDKITNKLCKVFNFKFEFENMLQIIIDKISVNFPETNIVHEIIENNEVFINVDKKTYRTVKYETFVMNLQTEILWTQGFNGFYFGEIDEH